MKQKTLSLFTMEELDDKLADYSAFENISLSSDISHIVKNRQEIEQLFKNPGIYKYGGEFKVKIQGLIELYYLRAISEKNMELQDSLINLVYRFHRTIDSLILQESIIFGLEEAGEETANQAKLDMLVYFYSFNAESFKVNFDEANFIRRINNQKRILRFFLYDIPQGFVRLNQNLKGDDIQNQLSKNTYLETLNIVPEDYLNFLSKKQKELLLTVLEGNILDIYSLDIPKQIGYMYIITNLNVKKYLHDDLILNEALAFEYRLYALLKFSSVDYNPFNIIDKIRRLFSQVSVKQRSELTITKDTEKVLRTGAEKILGSISGRKLSNGNSYLDSLEAEMLFTAAAAQLHEKYPDADLVEFLEQLKFTFVKNGNTEFIVQYAGSNESEYVRIAMDNNENYINSIKDFVESVYQRNKDGKTDAQDGKFNSVARGQLRLITEKTK